MPSPVAVTAARRAPTHPALRWTPHWDPANRAQHSRAPRGDGTRCGLSGPLVLAETTDTRCPACFPA